MSEIYVVDAFAAGGTRSGSHYWDNVTLAQLPGPAPELVPEPSSIALMTLGGAFMALGAYRRRRREDSNARVEA